MENPYAPKAVRGIAVARNQKVCLHFTCFMPITTIDALLINCTIVHIGTAAARQCVEETSSLHTVYIIHKQN